MPTIAELLDARAEDDGAALLFEDRRWSYRELHREACARASLLAELPGLTPPHVGVLLDNVPEFVFWMAAAALNRAVIVGINPTRRGAELEADIRATDCRAIVTDAEHEGLLTGLDLGVEEACRLVVDSPRYQERLAAAAAAGAGRPAAVAEVGDLFVLIFTSGTTGTPKAVRCTQGRLARAGGAIAGRFELARDVVYQAMPLFHSNALMAGWSPALCAGAPMALRRRFSASGWLPDVRRFGATYFNYVGKPLAYILATPAQPDDADNPVRVGFGNEANPHDIAAFAERFGCRVVDSYGSSEGGASISRTPETPVDALGPMTDDVRILDPATGESVPPARFDGAGRLLNAPEAIGELVSVSGPSTFEGYYHNAEADHERVHEGIYWTGDLAYHDERGFVYFAGRGHDWLRVDGENFAAGPIEAMLGRHPDVVLAAVYAVPDVQVGDQVMACVQVRPGSGLDAAALDGHLQAQPDLGTKWSPRYLRVVEEMPVTATAKVQKRGLRAEAWECTDPVWWRCEPGGALRPMTDADRQMLREQMGAHGRAHLLGLS